MPASLVVAINWGSHNLASFSLRRTRASNWNISKITFLPSEVVKEENFPHTNDAHIVHDASLGIKARHLVALPFFNFHRLGSAWAGTGWDSPRFLDCSIIVKINLLALCMCNDQWQCFIKNHSFWDYDLMSLRWESNSECTGTLYMQTPLR